MGDVACPLPRYIVPSLSANPFPREMVGGGLMDDVVS